MSPEDATLDPTGTQASEWSVESPRGRLEASTWRGLVLAMAQRFTEDELLPLSGRGPGRYPAIVRLPFEDERSGFYYPVTPRVAIYGNVSAKGAMRLMQWLCSAVGGDGRVRLERAAPHPPREQERTEADGAPAPETDANRSRTAARLARRLRRWRLSQGLKQSEAAQLIGCSPAAWGHWERGLFDPSAVFVPKLKALMRSKEPRTPQRAVGRESGGSGRARRMAEHRQLLEHLHEHGELTPKEAERLGISGRTLASWLGALLIRRPQTFVATSLFFELAGPNADGARFTNRLAARLVPEVAERLAPVPIAGLEDYVWRHFGLWHLGEPDLGANGYAYAPLDAGPNADASHRIDLVSRFPPATLSELLRDPKFMAAQARAASEAAGADSVGPLSAQMRRAWNRPLVLPTARLALKKSGDVDVGALEPTEASLRRFVVSGLPLCLPGDARSTTPVGRPLAATRLATHPLSAALIQLALLDRERGELRSLPSLSTDEQGGLQLRVERTLHGALWRHVRALLELAGFKPVAASCLDSAWHGAVDTMVSNLTTVDILARVGGGYGLSDSFKAFIASQHGAWMDGGERAFRDALKRYLRNL